MRLKQKILDNSLALRLLLTATVVLTLILALVLWLGHFTTRYLDASREPGVYKEAQLLQRYMRFDVSGRPLSLSLPSNVAWLFRAFPEDGKYRVVDRLGRVLLSSDSGGKPLSPQGKVFDPELEHFDFGEGESLAHVLTVEVGSPAGRYFLQVSGSRRLDILMEKVFSFSLKRASLATFLCAVAAFGLGLLFTFRRMLKPVRRVSAQAAAITPQTLHARLSQEGIPGEVRPLVESFNKTLAMLDKGYQLQREFLASAAHELKTPLALIRAQVELSDSLLDKKPLLRDIDLMTRQVHQLLHLAELSEIQNYQFEQVAPVVVIEDVVSYLERPAATKQILFDVCAQSCPDAVSADRSALFVLLKNLLENALHHAPENTQVRVTVCGTEISVRDEGEGIPAEQMPKLFVRFWRGPESHYEGAGLGLAICREIALAHGWTLNARNAGVGSGAVFVLEMAPEKN